MGFVENNKKNCKIEIEGKEYELKDKHSFSFFNKKPDILEIKLKGIMNIINMSYMFYECLSLSSLPDISNWNTSNVTEMNSMFYNCKSLSSLSDISNWNTSNVTDMSCMFNNCSSLSSLPDISKWDTNKLVYKSNMFAKCSPDLKIPSKFTN